MHAKDLEEKRADAIVHLEFAVFFFTLKGEARLLVLACATLDSSKLETCVCAKVYDQC